MTDNERIEHLHKAGQGNWRSFSLLDLDVGQVLCIARSWKDLFNNIERPWLCWNVDHEWCFVQQVLVHAVGWTPVVGYDPRVGPPRHKLPEAIVVDFNQGINMPVLYPHFPLEFAFLFADRLAFWHSDLLVRLPALRNLALRFERLDQGATAATWVSPGLGRRLFAGRRFARYWELVGCTTAEASRRQFDAGCGWWMNFWMHPKCPSEDERQKRKKYYWDHGSGIHYWNKQVGGRVEVIDGKPLEEGHCSKIGNSGFKRTWAGQGDAQRLMKDDLAMNFDLNEICSRLDLTFLVKKAFDKS